MADGGRAVAHFAAQKKARVAIRLPQARLYDSGMDAAEPTLGHLSDGSIFFVATDVDSEPTPSQVNVVRSTDEGDSWETTSPRIGPANAHFLTIDPYLWVDPATQRVFTVDLTQACSMLSFSDDQGASWTTNPMACGRPVNDHQTLFGGPPVTSPTIGYDNVVYYCWNDVLTSSCSKSIDGGLTFVDSGNPAFLGLEPNSDQEGVGGIQGFCTGLHGHGVAGVDGTIYLPRAYCNRAVLAISKDEGQTWSIVEVAKMPAVNQTGGGGANTSVAVDAKGNIYYVFVGDEDRLPYLTVSKDGGETWSEPLDVSAPGVTESNLATVDVGDPGKIAIAYYGSENAPGAPYSASYLQTTWNGYITMSADALKQRPVFMSASVNPRSDPLVRDRCGPGRCKTVLDFIDIEIAPDGTPWAAFVDSCIDQEYADGTNCVSNPSRGQNFGDLGLLGRLVGGPPLV